MSEHKADDRQQIESILTNHLGGLSWDDELCDDIYRYAKSQALSVAREAVEENKREFNKGASDEWDVRQHRVKMDNLLTRIESKL